MDLLLQLLVNGVVAGSIYLLLAIGFTLILGVTRIFHLAHGVIFTCAAYTAYFAKEALGLPIGVGLVVATAVAGLLGVMIYLGIYAPLIRRGASPFVILIASLGTMIFIENLVGLLFGNQQRTLGTLEFAGQSYFELGSVSFTAVHVLSVVTAVTVFVLVKLFLSRVSAGKSMRAVADNSDMADVVGIDSNWINLITFAIGSAILAPAAVYVALDTSVNPSMGLMAVLMASIAVILGGVGSVPGTAIGAVFISLAQNFGIWKLSSEWQSTIAFGVLVVVVSLRPKGLWGRGM